MAVWKRKMISIVISTIIFSTGLLHPEKSHLILAGDPKQLGPVLRSPLAQQYGLGNSRCCMNKYRIFRIFKLLTFTLEPKIQCRTCFLSVISMGVKQGFRCWKDWWPKTRSIRRTKMTTRITTLALSPSYYVTTGAIFISPLALFPWLDFYSNWYWN